MSQQQQTSDEARYLSNEIALTECIKLGVSTESVYQLAYEAGFSKLDIENLYGESRHDR